MIAAKNVSKVYGKKQSQLRALDDVSFVIPTGATAAIIGKSGSGKSTLMHILGGLDHPSSGQVVIGGKELAGLKRRELDTFRARELGFVFQSFFVEGNQTCYQNVALPLEINRMARGRRKLLVQEALEAVELGDKLREKARNLSGGQKQRLAIARAIVLRPKLIMADEPTGNLDSATGEKIVELLFGLNRSIGATLVIVTHDRELAARCQLQIELKDGKVVRVSGKSAKSAGAEQAGASRSNTPAPSKSNALRPKLPKRWRKVQ